MSRSLWKGLLKAAVGVLLIVWVLRSRMVDFSSLGSTILDPLCFVPAFGFLACSMALQSCRWMWLMRGQGIHLSFRQTLELTMIGVFFNTFMPGAIGGDLIKGWYIAQREPSRKTRAVFTVLLDRALGLAMFLAFASVALLAYRETVWQNTPLRVAALSVWGITLIMTVVGLFFFMPLAWRLTWVTTAVDMLRRNRLLGRLAEATLLYRHHLKVVVGCLVLSALAVVMMTLFLRYLGLKLGVELETAQYFFVVPLALTASAIPILPGGIGVGQVAFYTLFLWVGVPNPDLGGTLSTLHQIYVISFNCLGAVFYLRYKREPGGLPSRGEALANQP